MTWVRIDDGAPHHEKLLRAGPEAAWLWVAALAHANRQTTDGVITVAGLAAVYPWRPWTRRRLEVLAATLVDVGLWELRDEGGWRIHDYGEYQAQAMRDAVRERRSAEAARKREWRGRQIDADPEDARGPALPRGVAPVLSIAPVRETASRLRGTRPTGGPETDVSHSALRTPASSGTSVVDTTMNTAPETGRISPLDLVEVLRARCARSITLGASMDSRVMSALGVRLAEVGESRDLDRGQIELLADWYAAGAMRWRTTPLSLRELAAKSGVLAEHIERARMWHGGGRPAIEVTHRPTTPSDSAPPSVTAAQYAADRDAPDPLAAVAARGQR